MVDTLNTQLMLTNNILFLITFSLEPSLILVTTFLGSLPLSLAILQSPTSFPNNSTSEW